MKSEVENHPDYQRQRLSEARQDLKFIAFYIATPLYLFYWLTTDKIIVPQFATLGLFLRLTVPLIGFISLYLFKYKFMKKHYNIPIMIFILWSVMIAHSVYILNVNDYNYDQFFSINNLVMFGVMIFTLLPTEALIILALAVYTPYILHLFKNIPHLPYATYIQNINCIFGTLLITFIYSHFKRIRHHQSFVQKRALLSDASVGARIAQITHDLRTPLQALTISKEMSDKNNPSAKLLDAGLTRIQKLCHEILETTRSPYYIDKEISSDELKAALEKELSLFNPQKGLVLEFSATTQKVFLDVSKIQRLMANLVNNSYKALAGNSDPKVIVRVKVDALGLSLSVIDNGIGFDAYKKAQTAESAKNSYGIGLQFCKQVCDYYGGDLSSQSQPGNTIVTASLPRIFA